jgi:hypothetical protein
MLMSQYYPPQNPYYPPRQRPEEVYDDYEYEDEDEYYGETTDSDTTLQRILIFVSGGCLVFICMSCFVSMFMGLWVLDPGSGLVETSVPGGDVGLTFEEPAFSDEAVVNEENVQLQILDVNRNVAVPGVDPVQGRELVVITIELVNLGQEEISFNESDFILINEFEEAYTIAPASASVDGALGRGKLGPDEGIEGRLVFDILAEESNMVLGWEGGRDVAARYIYIE